MPKARDQLRIDYELDVLRSALCPNARTKAAVKRAAVRWAYERLLAERLTNTSATMR